MRREFEGIPPRDFRGSDLNTRSADTRPLCRLQSMAQQVQVRQREEREQLRRVLRQAPIPDLRMTPQALDHVEGMLPTRAYTRTTPVHRALMSGQRMTRSGPLLDSVADAARKGRLAIPLAPVRAVAIPSLTEDNLSCAEEIGYGVSANRECGPPAKVGLLVKGTGYLLGDVMCALEDDRVCEILGESFPTLSAVQIEAALRMATMVVLALEREEE